VRTLDPTLRSVLELERRSASAGRMKTRLIRQHLGLSPTRYHQLLVRAIDLPEALAYDPMLVRRLRRLREARRRARRPALGRSALHG
jgi:Protein of unknown function (DUF3263)